jgi:hypothetical protein
MIIEIETETEYDSSPDRVTRPVRVKEREHHAYKHDQIYEFVSDLFLADYGLYQGNPWRSRLA